MDRRKKQKINASVLIADAPDLLEPFFDKAAEELGQNIFRSALPELARELPLLRYGKVLKDTWSLHQFYKKQRRLKAFLDSLIKGGFQYTDFEKLNETDRIEALDILVTELNNHVSDLQSEAFAFLFKAYVLNQIDHLEFLGIAHELKNINPVTFMFNRHTVGIRELNTEYIIENDDTSFFPTPFYTFSTTTRRMVTSGTTPTLTFLGRAFYDHVYIPMSKGYER